MSCSKSRRPTQMIRSSEIYFQFFQELKNLDVAFAGCFMSKRPRTLRNLVQIYISILLQKTKDLDVTFAASFVGGRPPSIRCIAKINSFFKQETEHMQMTIRTSVMGRCPASRVWSSQLSSH